MDSLTKTNISSLTQPQAQMHALELLKAIGLMTTVDESHVFSSNRLDNNEYKIFNL